MMILQMILLGSAAADGFYSQTLNAVHHYRTGYFNRNCFSKCDFSLILQKNFFCSSRTHILISILGSMIQKIRSEEERNARVAQNYEKQQKLNKIYDRISFLQKSCRCRFVCTGLRIAEWFSAQISMKNVKTAFTY